MIDDAALFVALAQIAGVFVGFGALISTSRRGEIDLLLFAYVRTVVCAGIAVIVGAIVPIGLERYGVTGRPLWVASSVTFFLLIAFVSILFVRSAGAREQWRAAPVPVRAFVQLLEIFMIQGPLLLIILGSFPARYAALYTTALVASLLQAAFLLAQVVFYRPSSSSA